ncbi:hypothetical protein EC844_101158 [Acinetobacter calcoaceticus]|uniref:Lipoprotein n=1 Tax=Acinetobacter calcoaceticus TaxID=471 RepID=A0A4R1Y1B2_ACICA|nr:hypothetical protein EC844_101158 [Acinetobacter calcoaceticus]
MRLKTLTLSLLGLSLSACSTYSINSHSTTAASLQQKASQGLNAIYENPSFDYNGQFNVSVKPTIPGSTKSVAAQRDPQLERQMDQYLSRQKIALTQQQKQNLYKAMLQEEGDDYYSRRSAKKAEVVARLLSDLQFSYDGSVHYRQKMASFNLNTKYQKTNLSVESKVPMVVDFKNHKFYVNYFGLMPILVNPEYQNNMAYMDFSKYKGAIDQVDLKSLVAYLKENTNINYVLADAQQMSSLPLTTQDKAKGMVEKIRLNVSLEELVLQQKLFELVNTPYFEKKIFNFEKFVEAEAKRESSDVDERDYSRYGMSAEEIAAHKSSTQLYQLVEEHLYPDQDESDQVHSGEEVVYATEEVDGIEVEQVDAAAEAQGDDAAAAAEEDVAYAEAAEVADGLSEAQCEALAAQPAKARIGDVTYCGDAYEIQVFKYAQQKRDSDEESGLPFNFAEIEQLFEQYQSTELVDAEAFKVLWLKHGNEIKAALAKEKLNKVVMDVGLDAQGRAIYADYDVDFSIEKFADIKFKMDMNILNYGKATAIPQSHLKDAKTIEEMSKGSVVEDIVNSVSRSIGISSPAQDDEAEAVQGFDQQVSDLSKQIYLQTKSYTQTYQAVFVMMLTQFYPEQVKHYSVQQLNEIARVYAYSYADEEIYNPQGKELAELKKLIEIHGLQKRNQYDDGIGSSVYELVTQAMDSAKQDQTWTDIARQNKQPKAAFAQYYVKKFIAENDVEASQKPQLEATAQILAQAYLDARNNKLTAKSVALLKADADEFIDYNLYRETFIKTMKHYK